MSHAVVRIGRTAYSAPGVGGAGTREPWGNTGGGTVTRVDVETGSDRDRSGSPPGEPIPEVVDRLCRTPTPVQRADRLAGAVGLAPGRLWIKRDDLTGLALGGNKARKLARHVPAALAAGADVLVTGGGVQSNHARMTAAAAAACGMGCVLVLAGRRPERAEGNLVLDELMGAEVRWVPGADHPGLVAAIEATASRLAAGGRRPWVIPPGGADPLGSAAYIDAVDELRAQVGEPALVVCADGTGGTHAGLAAGLGSHDRVLGVDVGARPDLSRAVGELAAAAARRLGRREPTGAPVVDRDHTGGGYGVTDAATVAAVRLAATTEGLVLDPTYTGKALAALVDRVAAGQVPVAGPVVFLHTGGAPALFSDRWRPRVP